MNRKEFIRMCGILGLGLPFQVPTSFTNTSKKSHFDAEVIIIGAGAGGLSAGYLLQQQGVNFKILEASSVYGGRMRIDSTFADFPIPLGAEWLETKPSVFQELVNNPSIQVKVETIADAPDRKFVNYSWFNFFEEYIAPSVANNITYDTIVKSIDYTDGKVLIHTQDKQYTANKVIVSVPLKILQDKDINFIPALPQKKLKAIDSCTIWEGFKAFIEFSKNFYADGHEFSIKPKNSGQKEYYNASLGQSTSKNILGLFVVGKPALEYTSRLGDELRDFILDELDEIFSKQATPNYIKHITQNWDNEPFIKGGYLSDDNDWRTVRELGRSVANKIYFAGGAYTNGENWVSVHHAALSARDAVHEILN